MHILVNQADVEVGLTNLNDLYQDVLGAVPSIKQAITSNVTTPALLNIWVGRVGIKLPIDWQLRTATFVSLRWGIPIPQALVLKDETFFSMVLVFKLLKWDL